MATSVLIPFTADCSHRKRALSFLLERLQGEAVVGQCVGEWRKAVAVNDALRRSTGDLLVIHDADVVADFSSAADAVRDGAPWAMPHTKVHRLDETATEQVYEGVDPSETRGRDQRPYPGYPGGGIVVLRRETYEQVPLDPRFVGWGQEDDSWGAALRTLAGAPWRGTADLFHLWHPPAPRMSRAIGCREGKLLRRRYWAAARKPDVMRALLAETREVAV